MAASTIFSQSHEFLLVFRMWYEKYLLQCQKERILTVKKLRYFLENRQITWFIDTFIPHGFILSYISRGKIHLSNKWILFLHFCSQNKRKTWGSYSRVFYFEKIELINSDKTYEIRNFFKAEFTFTHQKLEQKNNTIFLSWDKLSNFRDLLRHIACWIWISEFTLDL